MKSLTRISGSLKNCGGRGQWSGFGREILGEVACGALTGAGGGGRVWSFPRSLFSVGYEGFTRLAEGLRGY